MEAAVRAFIGYLVLAAELIGAIILGIALVLAVGPFLRGLLPGAAFPSLAQTRRRLGRGLILGLEFLVAADLLRSIQGPIRALESTVVLAIIVAVRIALALSVQHELRETGAEEPQGQEGRGSR